MQKPAEPVSDRRRRPASAILIALVFAVAAANALLQVGGAALGKLGDPLPLSLLQLASGLAAVAAAIGAWRNTRWSSLASVAYGVLTAAMLLSLPALLDLDAGARGGIWSGAMVVFLFGVAVGWFLHRQHDRAN